MPSTDSARPVALITGATSGIGFHAAAALAASGLRVYVTGRNTERGLAAAQQLRAAAGHDDVHFVRADASTVAGNQETAERFLTTSSPLDVLVNNVGAMNNDRRITVDGFEATLATNFVGPFVLTQALVPLLRRAPRGRIVNVGSGAHAMWKGDPFADLHAGRRYRGSDAYARSKLLNSWWTFALARRLAGTNVVANAVDPGTAWTPMTQGIAGRSLPMGLRALWPLVRAVGPSLSAERAARATIFVAIAPEAARLNGVYIAKDGTPAAPSGILADEEAQECTWEIGLRLLAGASTVAAALDRWTMVREPAGNGLAALRADEAV